MAGSPPHKFGQMIGNLLEEMIKPELLQFCGKRGLYLDSQGERQPARQGRKVSWKDKYGNSHDLDFVIEKGGSENTIGTPVAFVEVAWRRYTKHSRNKAQEIQGAILPIADKHDWDIPFLGAVLAGYFTDGSLDQMKSTGFEVLYFPYESIVKAFQLFNINVQFDETTPDEVFQRAIEQIESLSSDKRGKLKDALRTNSKEDISRFFGTLEQALDRTIYEVIVLPLYGNKHIFPDLAAATDFIHSYDEINGENSFEKYEIFVKYTNGDNINATFQDKESALAFFTHVFGNQQS